MDSLLLAACIPAAFDDMIYELLGGHHVRLTLFIPILCEVKIYGLILSCFGISFVLHSIL